MATAESLREDIQRFLKANFPQIEMHGGEASVVSVDEDAQEAHVNLDGACSGCGISPMTVQAIKRRLPNEVEAIDTITVTTGNERDTLPHREEGEISGPF